jgi:hypothetical protein
VGRILLLAALVVVALSAESCGGDGNRPSPTGISSPTVMGETRELAGITFLTWDAWLDADLGHCPSQNPEGPFLGAAAFSISEADLASIPIADKQKIRMCKLGGITVLGFPIDNATVELVVGPSRWPAYVPLGRLSVTDGDIVAAPAPSQDDKSGVVAWNTAVQVAPFGLVVSYAPESQDAAVSALKSIDVSQISVPIGKDIFDGDINGIEFTSVFNPEASRPCFYGSYGPSGTDGIATPSDSRLLIEPAYLPEGGHVQSALRYLKCEDQESAEVTYIVSGSGDQYWIVRKTGTREWVANFAADWYSPTTVAELSAVLVTPPSGLDIGPYSSELFVREEFGLTAIYGPDSHELVQIAQGLNR